MDDKIKIMIYFKAENINSNDVKMWFNKMCFFQPNEMRCKKYTKGKSKEYDENIFYLKIHGEVNDTQRGNITIYDNNNSISMVKGALSTSIITLSSTLTYKIYEENKEDILEIANDFIMNNYGISAYICSLEDWFWQHNEDIQMYELKGKSMEGIKIKKSDIFPDDDIVDIEYNPGSSHVVNGIWFGSCWKMWYGKEYYKYIPKEILMNFNNCYENKQLENDIIRITLYESPWDYDKKENRDRQWNFRKTVGVDEVAHRLKNIKRSCDEIDSAIEILEGNFEHGGIRLMKYYYNSEGELTERSKAIEVKIYELGEKGETLWSEVKKIINT